MKKIFLSIFLLGILIIPLKNVKAITFNEISTKYKEKYNYSEVDEALGSFFNTFEENATVTTTDNKITITTKSEDTTFTTTFNYSNNIITYKYAGKKDMSDETSINMLADTAYVSKLLFIIAELKGYSKSDLLEIFNSFDEADFTMQEYGLEITEFTIEENANGGHMSLSSIDTLKIDINKYLENNNNSNNSNQNNQANNSNNNSNTNNNPTNKPTNNSNDKNNNVSNPQTGHEFYLLGFISLAVIILIKTATTKKAIKKI